MKGGDKGGDGKGKGKDKGFMMMMFQMMKGKMKGKGTGWVLSGVRYGWSLQNVLNLASHGLPKWCNSAATIRLSPTQFRFVALCTLQRFSSESVPGVDCSARTRCSWPRF